MKTAKIRSWKSIFVLWMAISGNCVAQQSATIVGSVRATDGKPIIGATLTALGTKTLEKRSSSSAAAGSFAFPALVADTYEITATCETCSDSSTTVELAAGQSRTVFIELHTDSATTLIAIDTQATTVEMTSSRLGINMTAAETAALPVNGRTYAPLTLTAPGTVNGGTATFNDIRFSGQSGEQTDVRLDGVDASSILSAAPGFSQVPGFLFRLQASLDAIDEIRVDSALYPATEGHGSGGQVELSSKSGSDLWHGSFEEYFRNDSLDARNFFDGPVDSPLHMNQFGGSTGGALIKSKLFVFATAEQLYQHAGFNVVEQVPSEVARLSAVPVIQGILADVPVGSATSDPSVNTAVQSGSAQDNERTYSVRLDYAASEKDRFFARESHAIGAYSAPDDTTAPRVLSSILTSDQVVARWTRIQSANIINELTTGLNRSGDLLTSTTSVIAAQGILVNFGDNLVTPGSLVELPLGYLGSGSQFEGRHIHVGDLLTLTQGAHTIKIGGEVGVVRLPLSESGGTYYQFRDIASFLQNTDVDVTRSGSVLSQTAAQEQIAGFVQDEWRIAPNVLVNFGVRYEHYTATRDENAQPPLLDPFSLIAKTAQGGLYPTSRLGFDPRIGLSWAPKFGREGTVIRIGAGSYQAPVSLIDSLQPILDEASRTFTSFTTIPASGQTVQAGPGLSLPTALDASSFRHLARNYQYGISLQQVLPAKFVAQVAYVGSVARHLEQWGQSNPIVQLIPVGNDLTNRHSNNAFGAVDFLTNGGNSNYNALDLNLTRRLVDNLTLGASYGWSHSIGDSLGGGDTMLPQDPACLACERASNDFDVRQVFAANLLYDLPFGSHGRYLRSGLLSNVLGGWTTGAVFNGRTGLPINVTIERSDEIYLNTASGTYYPDNRTGSASTIVELNVPGGGESRPTLRPNLVPGVAPYVRNSTGTWLNAAAFSIPLPGTYGDLGRNSLRGPGFSQLDFQLSRRVRIGERQSVFLRAESFNVFNKANFANPQANLPDALNQLQPGSALSSATAPGFGQLVSTVGRTVGLGTSRQMQLSLRYEF